MSAMEIIIKCDKELIIKITLSIRNSIAERTFSILRRLKTIRSKIKIN